MCENWVSTFLDSFVFSYVLVFQTDYINCHCISVVIKIHTKLYFLGPPGNLPADVDLQTGVRGGRKAVCGQEVPLI